MNRLEAQLRRVLILEAYARFTADPCIATAWLLKLRMEAP
jgi:hypothetical protein